MKTSTISRLRKLGNEYKIFKEVSRMDTKTISEQIAKLRKENNNKIAVEVMDTITEFEEIIYLMDYFTLETLRKLCLHHRDKIRADTDLRPLLGKSIRKPFLFYVRISKITSYASRININTFGVITIK